MAGSSAFPVSASFRESQKARTTEPYITGIESVNPMQSVELPSKRATPTGGHTAVAIKPVWTSTSDGHVGGGTPLPACLGAPAPVPATYNSSTVLSSFLPMLADGDFPFTNGHAHDGDVRSVRGPRSGEGSVETTCSISRSSNSSTDNRSSSSGTDNRSSSGSGRLLGKPFSLKQPGSCGQQCQYAWCMG